jgi:hypothetical protein
MNILRTVLGIVALVCFSLGAFRVQHSTGPVIDWVAMGLAVATTMYLLP